MAEYILKTELPITTCRVCPCAEHTPFGTACPIKRGSEKRYGTCPLVEVPTHGRLIDADALQVELEEHSYPSERCWYYAEAGQFIDEAETVLEAST